MKKSTLVSVGIVGLVIVVAGAWVVMHEKPEVISAEPTVTHQVTVADSASTAADPQPAVSVATGETPIAQPVQESGAAVGATEPAAGTPTAQSTTDKPTIEAPAEELSESDKAIAEQFKDALSFPLTEARIEAFTKVAISVENTNSKWDVQIAAAETQEMAIEYSNFAVEEIDAMMETIPGLTLEQYNELVTLSAKDPEFYGIYLAYRDMIIDEMEQEKKESAEKEKAAKAAENSDVESNVDADDTDEEIKSVSTPANPDTNSTTQD